MPPLDRQVASMSSTPALVVGDQAPDVDFVLSRFAVACARTQSVVAVGDGRSLAHLPAPTDPTLPLFLLWSHAEEAARWADVLSAAPQVLEIDLPTLLLETLPAIAAAGGRVGPDWSSEPIEPELSPADLDRRLRHAMVQEFAGAVQTSRVAWVLQADQEVVGFPTAGAGAETIPVWADRHLAERVARRLGTQATVVRVPLAELNGRLLMSPRGLKAAFAPAYVPGDSAVRLSAWEFKAFLAGASRSVPMRVV